MFFQPPIVLIEDPPGGGVPVVFIHQVGIVFRYTPGGPGSSRHNPQSFAFVPDLASGFPRAAMNNGTILAGFKDQDLGFKRKDVLISQKEVPTLLHHIRRCEFTDIHMKAHDVGLPGPYWDVMTNVSKSCNIQSGDFMDSLVKADKLPVYGMSSIMRKPNLKE